MKIILIVAAILLLILIAIGFFLYDIFGPAGVIVPLIIMGFIAYVVYKIGLRNILIGFAIIVAVKIIVKIFSAVIDARNRRKIIRRSRIYRYDEPAPYLYPSDKKYKMIPQNIQKDNTDVRQKKMTNNCPNCGAIMADGVCPYCNTRFI